MRFNSFTSLLVLRRVFAGTIGLLPLACAAAPAFTDSSITVSSEAPRESEVVTFNIQLKNSGDAPAEHAQLRIEWPLMGFLLGVEGLESPSLDQETRKVSAPVSLPAGSTKVVRLDVLAPRDSGGDALTVSVQLVHYPSGVEHWDHKTITIDTRLSNTGVPVAGFRIAPAGLWVLGWFGFSFFIWILVQFRMGGREDSGSGWRSFAGPSVVATMLSIPVGFWMIFAAMAWRDYEALKAWPETTATIVGRRDRSETASSSRAGASGSGELSAQSEIISPEFALRYPVDGKEQYSTGYDTGSSIRVGGRVRREAEMRDWVPGATIPCWYNPTDPFDVVVRRGFGGAYVFALIPLPVFWIGLSMLKSARTRHE